MINTAHLQSHVAQNATQWLAVNNTMLHKNEGILFFFGQAVNIFYKKAVVGGIAY